MKTNFTVIFSIFFLSTIIVPQCVYALRLPYINNILDKIENLGDDHSGAAPSVTVNTAPAVTDQHRPQPAAIRTAPITDNSDDSLAPITPVAPTTPLQSNVVLTSTSTNPSQPLHSENLENSVYPSTFASPATPLPSSLPPSSTSPPPQTLDQLKVIADAGVSETSEQPEKPITTAPPLASPSPKPHKGLFGSFLSAVTTIGPHILSNPMKSTGTFTGSALSLMSKAVSEVGSISNKLSGGVGDELKDNIRQLSDMTGIVTDLIHGNTSGSIDKLLQLGPLIQGTINLVGQEMLKQVRNMIGQVDPIVGPNLNISYLGVDLEDVAIRGFSNIQLKNVSFTGLTYYTLQLSLVIPSLELTSKYLRTNPNGIDSSNIVMKVENIVVTMNLRYSVTDLIQQKFLPTFGYNYTHGVPDLQADGPLQDSLIFEGFEAVVEEVGGNTAGFQRTMDVIIKHVLTTIMKVLAKQSV